MDLADPNNAALPATDNDIWRMSLSYTPRGLLAVPWIFFEREYGFARFNEPANCDCQNLDLDHAFTVNYAGRTALKITQNIESPYWRIADDAFRVKSLEFFDSKNCQGEPSYGLTIDGIDSEMTDVNKWPITDLYPGEPGDHTITWQSFAAEYAEGPGFLIEDLSMEEEEEDEWDGIMEQGHDGGQLGSPTSTRFSEHGDQDEEMGLGNARIDFGDI